ncbi:hypothetical protein Dimus_031589, partial [Dionaea muscipula]
MEIEIVVETFGRNQTEFELGLLALMMNMERDKHWKSPKKKGTGKKRRPKVGRKTYTVS